MTSVIPRHTGRSALYMIMDTVCYGCYMYIATIVQLVQYTIRFRPLFFV